MNSTHTRIAIIATAALLGMVANLSDAQAQTRSVNGIQFSPSGSWVITEGTDFTPSLAYSSYNNDAIFCCPANRSAACFFGNENTGEFFGAFGTSGDVITSSKAFSNLKANPDGTPKRYAIALIGYCTWAFTFGQPIYLPLPGGNDIRPAPFTLTVTK